MNFKTPKNANYTASVVRIKSIIPLEGANTIAHTLIQGNLVIISKDTPVDSMGLFFPVECQLSEAFLSYNSLFRDATKNRDKEETGFFEDNRRIKALKLMGKYMSQGFFIPLESLNFIPKLDITELKEGDFFDEINEVEICKKYVVKQNVTPGSGNAKTKKGLKKFESKLIENQFSFHYDTAQLGRNIHLINPSDLVGISNKLHGCVSYDTLIETLNNGKMKIGDFVVNKVEDRVKSYDFSKKEVVFSPVENFYEKKDDGEWYELELDNGTTIEITGNNPVWLPKLNIYRKTEDLIEGDVLLVD